jgi:hypothetical protein
MCKLFAQEENSGGLPETDEPRPAADAARFKPLQPTHRVLRSVFHRAFSYAAISLP